MGDTTAKTSHLERVEQAVGDLAHAVGKIETKTDRALRAAAHLPFTLLIVLAAVGGAFWIGVRFF